MLEDFGLEPERFRLEWIASAEAQKFADVMTEMTEAVTGAGPQPIQHQGMMTRPRRRGNQGEGGW